MKEETKHFIAEYKQIKEWEEQHKDNYIDFNNYFKYSGQVEPTKVLISHYKYNSNSNCNDLHEHYINKKHYEKLWEDKANKNYPGRFSAEVEAYYWAEAENSTCSNKNQRHGNQQNDS